MTQRVRGGFSLMLLGLFFAAGCSDDPVETPLGCGRTTGGPAVVRLTALELDGTPPPVGQLAVFQVGDTIPVVVSIVDGSRVGTISFHVRYTSTLVAQTPTGREGPFLGCDGSATTFRAEPAAPPNEIDFVAERLRVGAGLTGSGEVATLYFTALNTGNAVFAFTGASIEDPQGMIVPASFVGTSIRVE